MGRLGCVCCFLREGLTQETSLRYGRAFSGWPQTTDALSWSSFRKAAAVRSLTSAADAAAPQGASVEAASARPGPAPEAASPQAHPEAEPTAAPKQALSWKRQGKEPTDVSENLGKRSASSTRKTVRYNIPLELNRGVSEEN